MQEELKDYIQQLRCPSYQAETTFISMHYWDDGANEPNYYWRCLKCLKLFKETLAELGG